MPSLRALKILRSFPRLLCFLTHAKERNCSHTIQTAFPAFSDVPVSVPSLFLM